MEVGRGSREALALLFRRYRTTVLNVASRILRNGGEAEDLCQDVFIYVFQKASVFDPHKGNASSWIIQIAYHRAFTRRRYLALRTHCDIDEHLERYPDSKRKQLLVDEIIAKDILNRLRKEVSEDQRRILELHLFEGYSLREVAGEMGLTLGCVRNRYYRALERLRTYVFFQESN
jgi:RNA polymerase sigma-70 factor (ECF subfamily)